MKNTVFWDVTVYFKVASKRILASLLNHSTENGTEHGYLKITPKGKNMAVWELAYIHKIITD